MSALDYSKASMSHIRYYRVLLWPIGPFTGEHCWSTTPPSLQNRQIVYLLTSDSVTYSFYHGSMITAGAITTIQMQTNNTSVAVPCRKQRLLCCIFQLYCCIWSTALAQPYADTGILRHCLGYFESWVLTLRELDAKTPYIAYVCLCMHRRMYSIHCSDKICFLQLRIKHGITKFCPRTHTALHPPMKQLTLP